MKALIYKEFILSAVVPTYLFTCFGVMLFIPNYPYMVPFFFCTLGLFFSIQNVRENHDTFYTATLPVKKGDVVRARCAFFGIIELSAIIIAVPIAIIRNTLYPTENLAGLNPGLAFFGLVFILFSIFNSVFLTVFYKSAYCAGKAFVFALVPMWIFIILCEASAHIPFLDPWLSVRPADGLRPLPILAAGILIYALSMFITSRIAIKNFEAVNL